MKALLFNFLFTVVTLAATLGYPLRHISQAKELRFFGEKRTPILCWVVQVHSGFKCQPPFGTWSYGSDGFQTQHEKAEGTESNIERKTNQNVNADQPSCTKQHFNEIAKELRLTVVHIFSRFSNHVLMCYVEDAKMEKTATLSRIDYLHPELLKPEKKTEFLYHKQSIEDRLLSHTEIISFHLEYIHQHKQRTKIPRQSDLSHTKTSKQGTFPHPVLHDKNFQILSNLKNVFGSMRLTASLQKLCNETKSLFICKFDVTDDIRSKFNRSVHNMIFSCCQNHSSVQKFEHANYLFLKQKSTLCECVCTVIKPLILNMCNEAVSNPGLACDEFLDCTNSCAILNRLFGSLSVHSKYVLLSLLNKADQSTSSSKCNHTLLQFYTGVIILTFANQAYPISSHENGIILNELTKSSHSQTTMESSSLRDSPFVQLFRYEKRKSFMPSSSSLKSPSSSTLLFKSKSRKKRSSARQLSSSPTISFDDPAYPRQWHLHNMATPSMDINVTSVWARGYNGSGVTVAVVDDGVQWQNDDLKANYEYRGSWDFNDDDPDPAPSTKKTANHHGTRCAGEIAAVANNSLCGVGVAYGAKIAGIRVLDGVMTDSLEAEAFNKGMEINDVYSCSWGPDDDGKTVDGPHLMAARAMRHGVEFGRHGYGSIFVVASGNGGLHQDNCNFDGYANSIYTMTIGAVDDGGLMPYYAEECASMLGVTFSSGTNNKRDIVTTDWTYHNPSGCTEKHTGTSAAAPLAAGMIALMLQARPCLTWRDVQYIIILTAKKVDVDLAHWQTNGAGLSHSHKHGFGLLSSWRMVNAARVWGLVPWMTSYSHTNDLSGRKLDIPKKGGKKNKQSLVVWDMVKEEDVRGYSLFTVESVQVTMWLSHPCRGTLSIKLVSPSKTVSVIAAPRPNDNSSSGFQDWTFTTVRCWGESPIGNWTLIISDTDNVKYGHGRLTKWRLTLFGTPMSRSEFDERRSQVESAMGGQYLSANHSLECPPPTLKTEMVEPFSEKTLKIVILCGVFFMIMALYETLEYMCCYGEEKKEHQEEVDQMRLARRMTERTLRAIESEYQSSVPNITDSATREGIRTINDLNALSPIGRLRRSRRNADDRNRANGGRVVENDGNGDDDGDADEDDLFDEAETSGLLRNNDNQNGQGNHHHHQSSSLSLSSGSSRTPHRPQIKSHSFTQRMRKKFGHLTSFIGSRGRNRHHYEDDDEDDDVDGRGIIGTGDASTSLINNGNNDSDEDEIFNASSSSSRTHASSTRNSEPFSPLLSSSSPAQSQGHDLELEMSEINPGTVLQSLS